jgi:transposase
MNMSRSYGRATSSTASYGSFGPVHRGTMCRKVWEMELSLPPLLGAGGFIVSVMPEGDLTPGEAADCKSYHTLIELPQPSSPTRAYDSDAIRDDLKQRGIRAVIPPRSNRTKTICYNKRLYRQRNCIERALGHLKINRAIAARYDQLPDSFLGMLYLATARYWRPN